MTPSRALVIGAGLAGAASASALARRGWQVQVIDAALEPASGASALPAGLMAPHLSADDGLLSRLTRLGVATTRAELERLSALGWLHPGQDWQASGSLEHRLRSSRPPQLPQAANGGSRPATVAECEAADLPADAQAVWHPQAAWVKPAALVRAWLATAGVRWQGGLRVHQLVADPGAAATNPATETGWLALDEAGRPIAQAPLVVIAAALGSADLAQGRLQLQPVRGQVSWGPVAAGQALPPFPVNGNGHLLPAVPLGDGLAWLNGSSYGHGETSTEARPQDHTANLARLQTLVPVAAASLAPAFADGSVRAWTGVRCASTDRRPLVGALAPGLWVATALGSRGLTLAALCGQLLAARVEGAAAPLPLDLATALDLARQPGAAYPA